MIDGYTGVAVRLRRRLQVHRLPRVVVMQKLECVDILVAVTNCCNCLPFSVTLCTNYFNNRSYKKYQLSLQS